MRYTDTKETEKLGVKQTSSLSIVPTIVLLQDIDLARDVLKSDTCSMSIPELDLEVGPGALSGRFTTVEGLLVATRDQLKVHTFYYLVFLRNTLSTFSWMKLYLF